MSVANIRCNSRTRSLREVSAEQLTAVTLSERKPVTLWEVASKPGDGRAERASAILDRLTTNGTLARFRADLGDCYAAPKEALIGRGPGMGTVTQDSLKSLMLGCRFGVTRYLRRSPGVTGL